MKDKLGLKDSLNERQFEAVLHNKGPCLLIAVAGSGKTFTIINRVVNLISNGINPSNICLLTFTNKAAGEMRNRADSMLEQYKIESSNKIFAGNFHSLAFSYIRANKDIFSISKHKLDTTNDLFRNSIKIIKKKFKTKGLPQSSEIISIYNKSINMMISIERVIMIKHKELSGYEEFVVECCEQYEEDKAELEYIDFNDMLVYFLKALKNNKDFKKMINAVYKYLILDEYQDTNPIQDEIVFNMLDKKSNNIMVVGDDAQSVFGFNGADYKNILNFPNKFDNCKIIKLEQNYRSTQQILNIPNAIMTSPDYIGFNKTLFSDKSGPLPDVTVLFSREEEAEYVANKIQNLIEQKGELYMNNIAVLFRSAFVSSELEIKLNIKDIKYKKFGGLGYFEKAHIKDFLSFLSAAYRSKDYISWLRILGLVSGIGEVKSSKMVKKIKVTKNTVIFEDKYKDESCWLELKRIGEMVSLLKKDPSINSFDKVKEDYFVFMENQSEYKENTYQKRRMDFIALKNIAEKFPNLKSFSNTLNSTEKEKVDKRQGNFVTLSTIHSAKGLEWNHLFIIGAVDGIFPSKRSFSSQEDMNEERRLMYVALTRAKTFLEITFYSEIAHMKSSLHQLNRFFSKDVNRSFYNFNYKKRDFEVIEKMRNFTNY